MNGPAPSPRIVHGMRSSGPQGTRLFTADELHRYAADSMPQIEEGASVAQPVLEGRGAGLDRRRFALRSGRQTIGRRRDSDIVVDDISVSASHAWIINQQGHTMIMNTLSTNGTFVNGRRVHEAILRHGDRVRLGQAEFVFLTRDARASRLLWTRRIAAGIAVLAVLGTLGWWLLG
jgi:pSer/pThr/pTyr-binding forkhead associated (FHA) protein